MSQIRLSKQLYSHKSRILVFSSKLSVSNPCLPNSPVISPKINISSNSTANPKPNLRKTNEVDTLMTFQKQEGECIHNTLQFLSPSQLLQVLEVAAVLHPFILHTILSILDCNPSLRPKTTSENLRKFFSKNGDSEEGKVVISDEVTTGKSKVCGYVSFKNGMVGGRGGQRGTRIKENTSSIFGPIP